MTYRQADSCNHSGLCLRTRTDDRLRLTVIDGLLIASLRPPLDWLAHSKQFFSVHFPDEAALHGSKSWDCIDLRMLSSITPSNRHHLLYRSCPTCLVFGHLQISTVPLIRVRLTRICDNSLRVFESAKETQVSITTVTFWISPGLNKLLKQRWISAWFLPLQSANLQWDGQIFFLMNFSDFDCVDLNVILF